MPLEKPGSTNIGLILLAAGESSRLGRPKQLLLFNGKTFLQHTIQVASASNAQQIIVVLGAHADAIEKEIEGIDVRIVKNTEWEEGMASSIRCGVRAFKEITSEAQGVILMVCDQPFVTASLLNELINAHQTTGKSIVACSYEDTFGPPAFFHRSLFEELLQLKGDVGARGIVRQHTEDVEVIPFPKGIYDVDTETDYEKIMSNREK
ncbi:MAG TPA: nucleotidyltransferase family protein [Flavitalea sp.]|nr:nucleotidyltransferase family protein [Flavitalea sp.]